MNVEVINWEFEDWRAGLEIKIDGQTEFSVSEGEPEDATLGRDYNDCCKIPNLLILAHESGKRGEELIINKRQEKWNYKE
jgi:hypothetical protein